MKEGMTINFNAQIVNNGGTINGDIVNPVYNFGAPSEDEKRRNALQYVDTKIQEQVQKDPENRRMVFLPYVAAIRVELLTAAMSAAEFSEKYGLEVSRSTFSDYVPRDISKSRLLESDTAAFENELRIMLK